jgi:hypothetical protein
MSASERSRIERLLFVRNPARSVWSCTKAWEAVGFPSLSMWVLPEGSELEVIRSSWWTVPPDRLVESRFSSMICRSELQQMNIIPLEFSIFRVSRVLDTESKRWVILHSRVLHWPRTCSRSQQLFWAPHELACLSSRIRKRHEFMIGLK